MKRKILAESLREFRRILEEDEPLALAILGAPASGKSNAVKNINDTIKDSRIENTVKYGETLTVDVLRDEFKSQKPIEQLRAFTNSFFYMKQKAEENPEEYTSWFNDIKKLWSEKLSVLMPSLDIKVQDDELYFQGKPAKRNMNALLRNKNINPADVLSHLDKYVDYKRVVRYFQNLKQDKAIIKQFNITYDESGDEPAKIINGMKKLHDKGYVTDVFLIHPENVATNLIQNFYRVITGGDGGRDSSSAIIQAYLDIEKNKHLYKSNAEDDLKTTNKKLKTRKVEPETLEKIKKANVPDDPSRGNKPLDIFMEVSTMKPFEALETFSKKMSNEQLELLIAILKYKLLEIKNLPKNAKKTLEQITQEMNNEEAIKIIRNAVESGKYKFAYGGVDEKILKSAESLLK